MIPKKYTAGDLGFDRSQVSRNAMEVVHKLQKKGYEGFLVGGCVRDLILGLHPKDFDVTTNARPEQVKGIFNRSRIIGRRFKIVHVTFGRGREREIIEVATYRAASRPSTEPNSKKPVKSRNNAGGPEAGVSDSGRLLDDNVYGTLDQDVERRDFTVNSLYYDPVNDVILDYFDGMTHLAQRKLIVIGDPTVRFAEDPVRMIRAVRFKAKLNLDTDAELDQLIQKYSALLADVPAARLFDEVLKLFHFGAALKTWKALCKTPLARQLFPLTLRSINSDGGHRFEELIIHALKNTDTRVNEDLPVMAGFLYAVLLWKPFLVELNAHAHRGVRRNEALWIASDNVFKIQNRTVSIPWRVRNPANEIWDLQARLENRVPRTIEKLLFGKRFRAAYDFLELRSRVGEVDRETVDWWTEIQQADDQKKARMIDDLRGRTETDQPRKRSRNRKRRRRGNSSQPDSPARQSE